MLFHGKALEIYTTAYQNIQNIDENEDLEVRNKQTNPFTVFTKGHQKGKLNDNSTTISALFKLYTSVFIFLTISYLINLKMKLSNISCALLSMGVLFQNRLWIRNQ